MKNIGGFRFRYRSKERRLRCPGIAEHEWNLLGLKKVLDECAAGSNCHDRSLSILCPSHDRTMFGRVQGQHDSIMNRDANVAASGETYTDIVRQQKKRGYPVFLVFIGDRVYNIALGSSEYLPRTLLSIWTKKAKQLFAIGLKMKTYLGAFLLIVGVAGVSSAAVAQTVLQACGPDIERYCPNAGPGKLKQCMKNHMQQLSPICIGTLVKKKQGMAQ